MADKFLTKPKVADGQRYRRFIAMTQRTGALDDVKGFEKAFKNASKLPLPAGGDVPDIKRTARRRGAALKVPEQH